VQVILRQFFSELTEENSMAGFSKTQPLPTLHVSMQALSDVFRDRSISSDISPACSPNLNPYDFFFWDCLKDQVYSSNPQTKELKENIHREISNIPAEHLQKVNQNFFRQCKEYLRIEGQHFQHL
jgi:hypothetical protein